MASFGSKLLQQLRYVSGRPMMRRPYSSQKVTCYDGTDAAYLASGALKPRPYILSFGPILCTIIIAPFVYAGFKISELGAPYLEELKFFQDDDDD